MFKKIACAVVVGIAFVELFLAHDVAIITPWALVIVGFVPHLFDSEQRVTNAD